MVFPPLPEHSPICAAAVSPTARLEYQNRHGLHEQCAVQAPAAVSSSPQYLTNSTAAAAAPMYSP